MGRGGGKTVPGAVVQVSSKVVLFLFNCVRCCSVVMEVEVAAAAYIYFDLSTKNQRRRRPKAMSRWCGIKLFTKRVDHGGDALKSDLTFQEVREQYDSSTRMPPVYFEYILMLIGGRISKEDTY